MIITSMAKRLECWNIRDRYPFFCTHMNGRHKKEKESTHSIYTHLVLSDGRVARAMNLLVKVSSL